MAAGRLAVIVSMAAFALIASLPCAAQDKQPELTAAEADGPDPERKLVKWNEYEGKYFTARLGSDLLLDYMGYSQDDESKQQMTLRPDAVLRDFRLLLKGKFPTLPRLTYTIGYMY